MRGIEAALSDIRCLDTMALRDTAVHRIDPRAKIVTTAVFLACVLSFERHEVSALLPFVLYPLALASTGRVPLGYVARKAALVSPFALLLAVPNLFIDRSPAFAAGPVVLSAGVLSFVSILARFALTVGTTIVLVGVTSFEGVCAGLRKLGAPEVMVVQLLLLYRYVFVLADEAARVVRARDLRSFGRRGSGPGGIGSMGDGTRCSRRRNSGPRGSRRGASGVSAFAGIVGHMFLRTIDRADRVHAAMCSRGFTGEMRLMRRIEFRSSDLVFTLVWSLSFAAMRAWDLPAMLGDLLRGVTG